MVLRKSNSQWSVSPETIMSHHYKLTKGMRSRIDMGPPFSMYNSPKSIHYIPRRVASADAARRPLSRPHRELADFIERTNPVDLKLPLSFRNSLYDFVKPKLLNDRNYQPPVHRKTQKPPLPPGTNQSLPKKKPSVPRRKTNEEILFKDAVYTNLIERGVYSDKFIIEITQIEMENWIGRLPWVNLEKLADEIYNELGVAMESQNKRSKLSSIYRIINPDVVVVDFRILDDDVKLYKQPLKRASEEESAFLSLDYLTMAQHAAKNWYQVVKTAPKGRFKGIKRDYEVEDVLKLRGSIDIEYTLAIRGANKLWQLLHTESFVPALGAQTGNQAVQMVRAGLKAIYLSGWQVAADANTASDMYPDQSLYPANSGPELCRRINKSLRRADQIDAVEAEDYQAQRDWYAPIVADAEAGFGGALNCFELMKAYIEGGAAGVHYEDQLGSEKKCGHMGGKVLIPTAQHIRHLNAVRLAADVCNTPTIIVARTDAESSRLLTSDVDERDHPFIDRAAGRTIEGFYRLKESMALQNCVARAIEYAPYCDLIWMETSHPTISDAREFAEGVRKVYPDKLFAYNCSPSFNWKQHLSPTQMEKFQKELGAMGFKYQFITLAGFHANSFSMFDLARNYKQTGMLAYSELQQREFSSEKYGYSAVKHQREVGTGYFDHVSNAITGGKGSTAALTGSTEEAQFQTGTLTASSEDEEIVQLTAPTRSGDEKILTPEALRFIKELNSEFNGRRLQLLQKRRQVQLDINQAAWFPQFDKNTENIRSDEGWKGAEIPHDLQDRRVEITGPTDRKMIINALNSGANVFMADFEDSNSPTWRNQLEGQINLYDAVRDNISYVHPITKKEYTVSKDRAVLKVRPRGWHLSEKHVLANNQPVSGSLFDFGMFAFHNAKVKTCTFKVD
ncbi:hypothetical protein WR25_19445 isoform B [Diploscapter pachys]|uniref:isocitrate lyase n=1 Tax=Diploscapter pachys TaxID=2018661 RepID=A0A2A2JW93_9BILA|nr:hypothetical protein WR25_19445 isoform B [Diploscapter pachys]